MDELEAVQRLLAERPPPAPGVVAAARSSLEQAGVAGLPGRSPVHLNGDRPMAGPDPAGSRRWRRWRGWLAPVAAAAAVAIVIGISVAISGTVGSHARRPAVSTPVAFRQVPPYFVVLTGHAVPDQGERAEVVATATGAVLGSVTVPGPHTVFSEVAAAGDDRTFVLAAQRGEQVTYVGGRHGPLMYFGVGPAKFYKLALARSGRPAALTALALPAPRVTGDLNGFALSPDGSKLAVSVLPAYSPRSGRIPPSRGAQLFVFSLATGAERTWTLPGPGAIGMNKPNAQSLSWADDNRTLLFQERLGAGDSQVQVRLLDTAASRGSLLADSRLVPFPAKTIRDVTFGVMLLSADGTKIITAITTTVMHGGITAQQRRSVRPPRQCGPFGHKANGRLRYSRTPYCQKIFRELSKRATRILNQERKDSTGTSARTYATYTEFSVRTGKPLLVLGRIDGQGQTGADVDWASTTGTAMIVDGPAPSSTQDNPRIAFGVLAGGTFTPLPQAVQAFLYSATW